jgi:hypothetical protein
MVAWRDLKVRRVMVVLGWVSGSALVALFHAAWFTFPITFTGILVTSVHALAFRCPKCGAQFQPRRQRGFSMRCAECWVRAGTRGGPSSRDAGITQ